MDLTGVLFPSLVQLSPTTNLGFLIQARERQLTTWSFNASSTIIGTWDSGPSHKPLLCNSSSEAVDEVPVPVSRIILWSC